MIPIYTDPTPFQKFMKMPVTGQWDTQTMKAWSEAKWVSEGWEQAEWVRPVNWELIFNALVPQES